MKILNVIMICAQGCRRRASTVSGPTGRPSRAACHPGYEADSRGPYLPARPQHRSSRFKGVPLHCAVLLIFVKLVFCTVCVLPFFRQKERSEARAAYIRLT